MVQPQWNANWQFLPKDTALALLSIHAKEMENSDHRKAWIQMFKADFFLET